MKRHNIAQIIADSNKGTNFVGIDYLTALKVNKTIPNPDYVEKSGDPKKIANPHFEQISKLTMGASVMFGASYEKMVKKKLVKEGEQVQELIEKLQAVPKSEQEFDHDARLNHLQENIPDPLDFVAGALPWGTRIGDTVLIEHKGNVYIQMIFMSGGDSTYRFGTNVIAESDITGYTKPKPKKEAQGGVKDKVTIRTIKLDSIVKLRINKEEYVGEFYYEEL